MSIREKLYYLNITLLLRDGEKSLERETMVMSFYTDL